jgi:hypothetical protein
MAMIRSPSPSSLAHPKPEVLVRIRHGSLNDEILAALNFQPASRGLKRKIVVIPQVKQLSFT